MKISSPSTAQVFLSAALLFNVNSVCAQETSPPLNVLFIAVDDLRPALGCYGDPTAVTPNIDRLANRSTIFNRAYCQQAVCNPSRSSVMTGRRPDTIRVWDLHTHFRDTLPDVVTLPQYFKQHGYHTQSVGKIYHDPEWAQDAKSWSVHETLAVTKPRGKYTLDSSRAPKGKSKGVATEKAAVADDGYIDGQVCDAARKILRGIKTRPFFLAVGFRRPHLPFSAPEKYWNLYDRKNLPLPAPANTTSEIPEIALHNWKELRGYRDMPSSGPLTKDQISTLLHGYYASTSYIDAQVGKLLDELDRLQLSNKTIIVLWSDHGYHLGEKGLWCKTTNFELDTRVPLLISSPRQNTRGNVTTAIVELVDLYPTLTDLADLPNPPGVEGVSLKKLLDNPAASLKKAAFSQFPRPMKAKAPPEVMGYSIRTANYRYTEWRDLEKKSVVARELYEHQNDPGETMNIAGKSRIINEQKKLLQMLRQNFPH